MTTISIDHITKIEGHASLKLKIDKNQVKKCELEAIEGARFFEGLLPGRPYYEAHEITSRICGICSCSHTIAGLKAIENAMKVKVSKQSELLRELIIFGERIRSHATHLYFFALPDYMGYESAIEMAAKNKQKISNALELIQLGNDIVKTIGGREMHPFTSVIGGFTHVPEKGQLDLLLKRLKESKKIIEETVDIFAKLKYPYFERKTEYIALKQKSKTPLLEGNIISTEKLNIGAKDYYNYIEERIETYATSKFAVKKGKEYMVGALARLNNNNNLLNSNVKKIIKKYKINLPIYNPFYNNLCQALELMHCSELAINVLQNNEFAKEDIPEIKVASGRGVAVIEAPRGLLFHDYSINKDGVITKANIITPTCQNLRNMETDIKEYVNVLLKNKLKKEKSVLEIEKLIRAYDPCFSCSTHFLKVKWL